MSSVETTPTAPYSAPAAVSRLVGRSDAHHSLTAALAGVRDGRSSLLVIEGVAGIGKTSVLDAFLDDPACRDAEVRRVVCHESDAYAAARRLLFADGVGRSAAAAPSLHGDAQWALPVVRAPASAGLPGITATYQTLQGLHAVALTLAAPRPLVLAIDEAHRCDEPTLRWLDYLLRRSADAPILVILVIRSGGVAAGQTALTELLGEARHRTIALSALSAPDIADMIRRATGTLPTDDFTEACAAVSGGVPGLLARLIEDVLRAEVTLDAAGSAWVRHVGPSMIVDTVTRSLAEHPPPVRAVAAALAVLDDADRDLLIALTHVPRRGIDASMDALRCDGLLDGHSDRLGDVVRGAVLDELRTDELTFLRSAAARLLNDAGRSTEAVADQILPLPDPLESWMLEILRDAASRADRHGTRAGDVRYRDRLRLASYRTPVLQGRPGTDPAPFRAFPESESLSTAMTLFLADDIDAAGELLDQVIDADGHRASVTCLALATRSLVSATAGDPRAARLDAQIAADMAGRGQWGAQSVLPPAVLAQMLLHHGATDRAYATLASIAPPESGSWDHQLLSLVRARVSARSGDPDDALTHLNSCARMFDPAQPALAVLVPWWIDVIEICVATGRDAQGAALAEAGIRAAAAWGTARATGLGLLARGLLHPSDHERVTLLEQAVDCLSGSPSGRGPRADHARARYALARAQLAAGDLRGARESLRRLVEESVCSGARDLAVDARRLLVAASGRMPAVPRSRTGLLTNREWRVVELATEGHSNRAIAGTLFVSLRTVEAHLTSVYRKVGVRGRAELIAVMAGDGDLRHSLTTADDGSV